VVTGEQDCVQKRGTDLEPIDPGHQVSPEVELLHEGAKNPLTRSVKTAVTTNVHGANPDRSAATGSKTHEGSHEKKDLAASCPVDCHTIVTISIHAKEDDDDCSFPKLLILGCVPAAATRPTRPARTATIGR
jgi:hypothetical protein